MSRLTNSALASTLRLTKVQINFKMIMDMSVAIGTAAIFWFGAQHALAKQIGVGDLYLFLSYLGLFYGWLASIMYTGSTIQGAAGSARRVLEVLHSQAQVTDRAGAQPLKGVGRRGLNQPPAPLSVQFENVTFGYDPDRPVLRNISLQVKPGETLAIVGATGAGKSTLVSLLPRFFDPSSGRVLLNGQDLRDVRLKSLRGHIAIVLQEPFLFPVSLADNIAYGSPRASFEQIQSAARAANAIHFIERLPQGYQTVVGDRGATLSGGERQRISIARAFLKDAPLLILDEPTSALDSETERGLLEALEHLTQGRTTFIIAHRLSTIRRATRIIVLKDGSIAETGTHEELLRAGGHYARLTALQNP